MRLYLIVNYIKMRYSLDMPLSNKAINFVTSFLFFQIAHFETGDNFWRFMALLDSDDEMGEVEGENGKKTIFCDC